MCKQRCEVHRHGGEEVQRWCSKVVKMFSGAEVLVLVQRCWCREVVQRCRLRWC